MSIETGIAKLLTSNSAVAALISTRVYPLILPEKCTFPAVTYQRISTVRVNTLDNGADTPHARFQISCWAANFLDAENLEAAIRNVLAGFAGLADDTTIQSCTLEDRRDTWEFEISLAGMFRIDSDWVIWYEES